jgi:hypothetical protein
MHGIPVTRGSVKATMLSNTVSIAHEHWQGADLVYNLTELPILDKHSARVALLAA